MDVDYIFQNPNTILSSYLSKSNIDWDYNIWYVLQNDISYTDIGIQFANALKALASQTNCEAQIEQDSMYYKIAFFKKDAPKDKLWFIFFQDLEARKAAITIENKVNRKEIKSQ